MSLLPGQSHGIIAGDLQQRSGAGMARGAAVVAVDVRRHPASSHETGPVGPYFTKKIRTVKSSYRVRTLVSKVLPCVAILRLAHTPSVASCRPSSSERASSQQLTQQRRRRSLRRTCRSSFCRLGRNRMERHDAARPPSGPDAPCGHVQRALHGLLVVRDLRRRNPLQRRASRVLLRRKWWLLAL